MKTTAFHPRSRRQAGATLLECMMYIALFMIILSGALATFYYCWDNSKVFIGTTDDIAAVLRAGENWRADVRTATGPITHVTGSAGEDISIPVAGKNIVYHFTGHTVSRETSTSPETRIVLARVQSSQMTAETHGPVTAWRWDVKLTSRGRQNQLPLQFTFAAVPSTP